MLQNYSAQNLSLQAAGNVGELELNSARLSGEATYNGYARQIMANGLEVGVNGRWSGVYPLKDINVNLALGHFKVDRSRGEFLLDKFALRSQAQAPDGVAELAFDVPDLSMSADSASGA